MSEKIDGKEVPGEDGPGYPLKFPPENPYGEEIRLCALFSERVDLTEVEIELDDNDETLTWSLEVTRIDPDTNEEETFTVYGVRWSVGTV